MVIDAEKSRACCRSFSAFVRVYAGSPQCRVRHEFIMENCDRQELPMIYYVDTVMARVMLPAQAKHTLER